MEKLKIYAKTVEQEALDQINQMNQCEAYKDCIVRIMPDCHAGAGCTIGTVIAVKDRVVPNTVGVDIGCGMLVIQLGNIDVDLEKNLIRLSMSMFPQDSISGKHPTLTLSSLIFRLSFCDRQEHGS